MENLKHEEVPGSNLLCKSYIRSNCGYIIFNDEDDGYRIFWINLLPKADEEIFLYSSHSRQAIQPKRFDIIGVPHENAVNEVISDSLSGLTIGLNRCSDDGQQLGVAFEAYLHIDALLCDILERRKNLFFTENSEEEGQGSACVKLPEFFYNLISTSDDGRTLTIVIAFSHPRFIESCEKTSRLHKSKNKCSAAAIALYVALDLFDSSYSELGWVQHNSRHGAVFLRQWSNTLAVNRRMIEMRVGVFCVGDDVLPIATRSLHSFGIKTHESNCHDTSDTDVDLWQPFVLEKLKMKNIHAPKKVAMSSLYPFCDVISNEAVTLYKPVTK